MDTIKMVDLCHFQNMFSFADLRQREKVVSPSYSLHFHGQTLIKQASDVTNKLLLSIVEEPEQNQYPTSQREVLYKLIDLHNGENDQLVITTHSPYIINYLALAIKAYDIARQCPAAMAVLDKVVPQASMIDGTKVTVYQVYEDGTISLLPKYDEMPSDDNLLNNLLEESNEQFNQLLDIEEECQITK